MRTQLKSEIQHAWTFIQSHLSLIFAIVTLSVIVVTIDDGVYFLPIEFAKTLVVIILSALIEVSVVYLYVQNMNEKEVSIRAIFRFITSNIKEILILIGIGFVLFIISMIAFIPGILLPVVKIGLLFIWPIFVIQGSTRFTVIKESASLAINNWRDLLKYAALYITLTIAIGLLKYLVGQYTNNLYMDVIMYGLRYLDRFVSILSTIIVTRLYCQYTAH